MKRIILLAAVGLWAMAPDQLHAQWTVGPHILISFPNSDFANVTKTGGGFGIKVARNLSPVGGLGLRGDFAFLSYGRDYTTVQSTVGPLFAQKRYQGLRLTFGPQYEIGTRNFKAHAEALGGFFLFRTDISIDTGLQVFTTSSDNEAALGWNVGGGFMYDIGLGPWLDVALEYQSIYNVPAPQADPSNPGATIKRDITAHEITLKVGVIFFLK